MHGIPAANNDTPTRANLRVGGKLSVVVESRSGIAGFKRTEDLADIRLAMLAESKVKAVVAGYANNCSNSKLPSCAESTMITANLMRAQLLGIGTLAKVATSNKSKGGPGQRQLQGNSTKPAYAENLDNMNGLRYVKFNKTSTKSDRVISTVGEDGPTHAGNLSNEVNPGVTMSEAGNNTIDCAAPSKTVDTSTQAGFLINKGAPDVKESVVAKNTLMQTHLTTSRLKLMRAMLCSGIVAPMFSLLSNVHEGSEHVALNTGEGDTDQTRLLTNIGLSGLKRSNTSTNMPRHTFAEITVNSLTCIALCKDDDILREM